MKKSGFNGFLTIGELMESNEVDLEIKGVYFVLYVSESHPTFVKPGTGGHFNGKDPNVPIDVLKKKWVDETKVIYIGKGGEKGKESTLHSRLSDFLDFGQGKKVGHWGGRYIYQIEEPKDLVVCWKNTNGIEPEDVESNLITKFISTHCKLPFGNLI